MAKTWRVGVVGLGHWYSAFGLARALPEYSKAELVAVAYHDEPKAREFGRLFSVEAYTDYDDLLAREDIDIVHICPPGVEMPDCTIKAARARKHIILGKPLAMSVERAAEMVEVVEGAGVVCVPWPEMYRVTDVALKARLDGGLIGDIAVIHATGRWSIGEDWLRSGKVGWFADPIQTPGGAMIDEGMSSLGWIRWLAGSDALTVDAKVANYVHKDIGVEDWALASFTFDNGIIATLENSWTINSPQKTGPSPKQNGVIRTEIIGTRGEVIQERLRVPSTAVLASGAPSWVFERPMAEYFVSSPPGALDYLITCIERGQDPEANIQQALKSFRMVMSTYEAARTGTPVKLSL
jgi:predicted dehydrogenase